MGLFSLLIFFSGTAIGGGAGVGEGAYASYTVCSVGLRHCIRPKY